MARKIYFGTRFSQCCITFSCKFRENFIAASAYKVSPNENFVKALHKESRAFIFLKQKFLRVSQAKLTAGISDGPQIRELLKNHKFDKSMQDIERKV